MMTPLINRRKVRELALFTGKQTRGRPPQRVSSRFLEECNLHLEAYVRSRVH